MIPAFPGARPREVSALEPTADRAERRLNDAKAATDGAPDRAIELSVPRPTGGAFGGNDPTRLYIAAARARLPAPVPADALLSTGGSAVRRVRPVRRPVRRRSLCA